MAQSGAETTPLLGKPYSVFTTPQKRLIILTAAVASTFSPLSANIYYPALNSLAADLHVSPSQINLTITTYMLCQALAPTLTGTLADHSGRRPAYILCFTIYFTGNILLALQRSFPALLILRAVQSCGSSGTVALAAAVAADVTTPAERGSYLGLTSLGNIVAPALGPMVGGAVSQYIGWPAIFWGLAMASGAFLVPFVVFFPETGRGVVGDGSGRVAGWNRSILAWWRETKREREGGLSEDGDGDISPDADRSIPRRLTCPSPLATLRLLVQRPTGFLLLANGVVFASYYAVTAGIPSQFHAIYGLDDLRIGMGFIPAGLGSLTSAMLNGRLLNWNYRRMRRRAGLSTCGHQKLDHDDFPVEQARLQIGLPMTVLSAVTMSVYGIVIDIHPPLYIALLLVFAISLCITAAYNVMNILLVDLYYNTPATAMAANNLVRCLLGAAATALIHPMIQRYGNAGAYLMVAGVVVAVCPLLGLVYMAGLGWRRGVNGS